MTDTNSLIKSILEDAVKEEAKIKEEALKKAEGIVEDAKKDASLKVERAREAAKLSGESYLANVISDSKLNAKKELLEAKRALLNEAYLEAAKKLCALDEKAYVEWAASMIKNASKDIDTLIIGKDEKVLGEKNSNGLKVVKSQESFGGGFILQGKGLKLDLRFSSLISDNRSDTEAEVAMILFGGK